MTQGTQLVAWLRILTDSIITVIRYFVDVLVNQWFETRGQRLRCHMSTSGFSFQMGSVRHRSCFLHSTIDRYIEDAKSENKNELLEIWNTIKQDKQKHMDLLKGCLEKEVSKVN